MNRERQSPYFAMIVDDEPFVRKDLKFLLGEFRHISVEWETGSLGEARDILGENELDLLFLDIRIRGGSGFDLIPYVDFEKTALIFVSAHAALIETAKKFPGADTLLKPVDRTALARALKQAGFRNG